MKLDQFMMRFRDLATAKNRERGENYKKGQFESDSDDDAVVKPGRFNLNILGDSAPKDAYGNSDIQTLQEYVNNF